MLARQAAAAVGVGTRWPWETAATLPSCLLGSARRFGAHGGREGRGHIVAAVRLQLVIIIIIIIKPNSIPNVT